MADVSVPSGFGGLMRYSEEYTSKINLKPAYVIAFVVLIIAFRVALPLIF